MFTVSKEHLLIMAFYFFAFIFYAIVRFGLSKKFNIGRSKPKEKPQLITKMCIQVDVDTQRAMQELEELASKIKEIQSARSHSAEFTGLKNNGEGEAFNAAINFALDEADGDGLIFLEMWREGQWQEIAHSFPQFDLTTINQKSIARSPI
jgi:hypothetical protein